MASVSALVISFAFAPLLAYAELPLETLALCDGAGQLRTQILDQYLPQETAVLNKFNTADFNAATDQADMLQDDIVRFYCHICEAESKLGQSYEECPWTEADTSCRCGVLASDHTHVSQFCKEYLLMDMGCPLANTGSSADTGCESLNAYMINLPSECSTSLLVEVVDQINAMPCQTHQCRLLLEMEQRLGHTCVKQNAALDALICPCKSLESLMGPVTTSTTINVAQPDDPTMG